MSPLSEKFLLGRLGLGETPGVKIDTDRPCANCGYNLRGLNYGRNCPECGTPARRQIEEGPAHDLLGSGDPEVRRRMQLGLTLGAISLAFAVIARWGALAAALATGSATAIYGWAIVGNGVLWVVAVWVVTPAALDHHWRRLVVWRWAVRLTQLGWPIGLMLLVISRYGAIGQALQSDLMKWQVICRFVAGIGLLQFIAVMHVVANGADLEDAPRRLYKAGWLLPIAAVFLWSFPSTFPWIFLLPLLILLVAWSWAMGWVALALWEMRSVAMWSLRAMHESVERESRIARKQADLDEEAARGMRPVSPARRPDLPLEP